MGLQNPGVDHVLAVELPQMAAYFHKKVIANVGGFSVEDYVEACGKLSRSEQVGLIEVNISCPNVEDGGMSFGVTPEAVGEVTRAVKAVSAKPVYVKLSPNVTDIVSIARACEEAGAQVLGIVSIFTYGMQKGLARLAEARVENHSLTNFDIIAEIAAEERYIRPEDVVRLVAFRDDPSDESWIGK